MALKHTTPTMASQSASLCLAAVMAIIGVASAGSGAATHTTVMPWMCLERCSENWQQDIKDVESHASDLGAISFEAYDLGSDSALIDNGFANVNPQLKSAGLLTFPMITTVDIYKIRALAQNPTPFITAAIAAARTHSFSGFNFDFEPCQSKSTKDLCTNADAQAYAGFLTRFSDAAHAQGLQVSVCAASWSPFFNFTAFAHSTVDRVVSMDTYAFPNTDFDAALERNVAATGVDKVSMGLCTDCGGTLASAEVQRRFDAARKAGVKHVGIWDTPVPASWWPAIESFGA